MSDFKDDVLAFQWIAKITSMPYWQRDCAWAILWQKNPELYDKIGKLYGKPNEKCLEDLALRDSICGTC